MGLAKYLKGMAGLNNLPPPISESVDEAAQQVLNKRNKVDVAADAVLVNSLSQLDADERQTVAEYKSKTLGVADRYAKPGLLKRLFGGGKTEDDMSVYVTDDVSIRNYSLGWLPWLATVLIGGGVLWKALDKPEPVPEVQPVKGEITADPLHLRIHWWVDGEGQLKTRAEEVQDE